MWVPEGNVGLCSTRSEWCKRERKKNKETRHTTYWQKSCEGKVGGWEVQQEAHELERSQGIIFRVKQMKRKFQKESITKNRWGKDYGLQMGSESLNKLRVRQNSLQESIKHNASKCPSRFEGQSSGEWQPSASVFQRWLASRGTQTLGLQESFWSKHESYWWPLLPHHPSSHPPN